MWALAVCRPISKLANISSQVLWRMAVLLLVLLAGVASSLTSTLGGAAVSAYMISWRCMFRVAICGERRGGAALGISGAAVWSIVTFGDRCGRSTLGLYIPVSTPLCEVLEGMGGDR